MVNILSKRQGHLIETADGFSGVIQVPVDSRHIEAEWIMPAGADSIVIFAHGSGSGRHSARNQFVASVLRRAGLGTVLLDLLTKKEELEDATTRRLSFDVELLSGRLMNATRWVANHPSARDTRIGYFGASTGAAAAVNAAAALGGDIGALVSRGGRPDLAMEQLGAVTAPTLLIVGEADEAVLELNTEAFHHLRCVRKMAVIPGATHLFEEPGALDKVANLAAGWFVHHLAKPAAERMEHARTEPLEPALAR
jgi:putative phosphoribosyl transferase